MDRKELFQKLKQLFEVEESTDVKFADYKTMDGKIIRVPEALEVESPIMEVTEEGEVALEDGKYEIEDLGIMLVVTDGMIAEIIEEEEAESEDEAAEDSEEVEEEMEAETEVEAEEETETETEEEESEETEDSTDEEDDKLASLESKLDELLGKFNDLSNENEELKSKFEKFSGEASVESINEKINFSEMSKADKLAYYSKRGNK